MPSSQFLFTILTLNLLTLAYFLAVADGNGIETAAQEGIEAH